MTIGNLAYTYLHARAFVHEPNRIGVEEPQVFMCTPSAHATLAPLKGIQPRRAANRQDQE